MAKIKDVVDAFVEGKNKKVGNYESFNGNLFLFGHKIARWDMVSTFSAPNTPQRESVEKIFVRAPVFSHTTIRTLNMLPGVHAYTKNKIHYLNGKIWDGDWIEVTVDIVPEELVTNDQLPEYVFGSQSGPSRVKQRVPAFRYSKK